MAILTNQEAAEAINYSSPDEMPGRVLTVLLPAAEGYLEAATGKNWAVLTETYTAIDPGAKAVVSMILAKWFDGNEDVGKVVISLIAQLKAKYHQELLV